MNQSSEPANKKQRTILTFFKPSEASTCNIKSAHIDCPKRTFPTIHTLLRLFLTFPVTNATGERSFTTLDFIKDFWRTTMTQDRLNGLARMHIHFDEYSSQEAEDELIKHTIDKFGRMSARRATF